MNYSIAVAGQAPAGYPAIYKNDLYEGIRKAREYGYSGIEWHLRRPEPREAEAVKRHCDTLKMPVTSLGTGMGCVLDGLTLMHADPEVRMHAVQRLKAFIDLGEMLGSAVIIGSMKGRIPAGGNKVEYEAYLTVNLEKIVSYAESKKVTVVLEVLNRYETDILCTMEQMHAFVGRFGSRFLKMHIDTFHMNIEEPDMQQSIEKCRETLGHVHLADSNRHYPGAGHIDFTAVLRALKDAGYNGVAAVECLPCPDPDSAAKNAIEYLSALNI